MKELFEQTRLGKSEFYRNQQMACARHELLAIHRKVEWMFGNLTKRI